MTEFRVEVSWTKFLKFSCQTIGGWVNHHLFPLYLYENGGTFLLLSDQGHIVRYNRNDDKVERRKINYDIYRPIAMDYIESLVSTC
jgi:hypothetical protein